MKTLSKIPMPIRNWCNRQLRFNRKWWKRRRQHLRTKKNWNFVRFYIETMGERRAQTRAFRRARS